VFVITGDGDALSIGGNHLIHTMRRNANLTIILFNNQIYGLTKGQYSPTSEFGKITKSTPVGSVDWPFNPVSVALGAEATFVARSIDNERKHLAATVERAAAHEGTAFVEVYQNCNIFNDGAFDAVRGNKPNQIHLEHGQPIRFGEEGERGVVLRDGLELEIVDVADVGEDALLVHDAHREDPSLAFALSRLAHTPAGPTAGPSSAMLSTAIGSPFSITCRASERSIGPSSSSMPAADGQETTRRVSSAPS
jgi:2-oxoglutarate ferredoxin oxidoreductase subunit beta